MKQQLIALNQINNPLDRLFLEMKSQGMSDAVVETYYRFNRALLYFANKPATDVDENDIKSFLLIIAANNTKEVRKIALSAIKFLHCGILGKTFRDL